MSNMEITLYVKIHNVTGLKYFGKTTKKNPEKYIGSGKYWKSHIKKHGYDVTTTIVGKFSDPNECRDFAINYSIKNNIVESTEWANLVIENGMDGAPAGHSGHKFTADQIKKLSDKSVTMWGKDEFREMMRIKQSESWTEQRKQEQRNRLTGIKRPEHSKKLLGRSVPEEQRLKMRKPKHQDHGKRVSAALAGVPKSEEHKQKLRVPKPKVVCRIHDKKEMALGNFMNWCKIQDKLLLT